MPDLFRNFQAQVSSVDGTLESPHCGTEEEKILLY
jgi:hypothetical protein